MADYIDRQAVNDALDKTCDIVCQYSKKQRHAMCGACPLGSAYDVIENVPAADVQPVRHGHWMLYENQNQDDVNNGNYLYVCSNCNHSDVHAKTVEVPFCWFCGARMDGEQND